ncbi:MAG: type IV secretory system conjugative DNA transfer family protein [Pseudomonadota bacterium]
MAELPESILSKMTPATALMEFAYAKQDCGFYLGEFDPAQGVKGEAGFDDDRHVFILAGTRGGKGTTSIINNLLRWAPDANGAGGGVFVIDPKGENAAITACARGDLATARKWGSSVTRCMGQKVAVLDPLGVVEGPAQAYRVDYNPFVDVDITDMDGAAGEMETFCEAVIMPDEGTGAHFTETVSTLVAGAIEYTLHTEDRRKVTWPYIRDWLVTHLGMPAPKEGDHQLVTLLESIDTPEGLTRSAALLLRTVGPREYGSIVSTLLRQMRWLNNRMMTAHLMGSLEGKQFSLKRAVQENWTVYVCIPPGMINRYRRWLRLMVAIALDAKTQSPFEHEGPQTLFILDEFAALGSFSQIEIGASNLAGYGIKLVTVIQNIGQIQKTYERNWETFLGNAGLIIAWALNDKASEDYISQRMGQAYQMMPGFSVSKNERDQDPEREANQARANARSGLSRNISIQAVPIMWPNEVRQHGGRPEMRGFVITADGKIFPVKRIPYHRGNPSGLYDSPDFIKNWIPPEAAQNR